MVKRVVNFIRKRIRMIPYLGTGRYCTVCKKTSSQFRSFGGRKDAQCVHCGSLERHRFLWQYMLTTDLFSGKHKRKMLHVAPETCFQGKFNDDKYIDYITADISDPRAMVKMDITDIKYHDNYFDVIYCSHVLEHVQDDRMAMREFYRVLKTGGVGYIACTCQC